MRLMSSEKQIISMSIEEYIQETNRITITYVGRQPGQVIVHRHGEFYSLLEQEYDPSGREAIGESTCETGGSPNCHGGKKNRVELDVERKKYMKRTQCTYRDGTRYFNRA
ncbi:hypothetical protein ScPMuIL_008810 [Solemya velum]